MSGISESLKKFRLFYWWLNDNKADKVDRKLPKSDKIFVSYIHIRSFSLQTIDKSILVERLRLLFANCLQIKRAHFRGPF